VAEHVLVGYLDSRVLDARAADELKRATRAASSIIE
jgi:hypothetical protein